MRAEAVVILMHDAINERVATRTDLTTTESALRGDMEKMELRMTVKFFLIQASFSALLFAALRLFLLPA